MPSDRSPDVRRRSLSRGRRSRSRSPRKQQRDRSLNAPRRRDSRSPRRDGKDDDRDRGRNDRDRSPRRGGKSPRKGGKGNNTGKGGKGCGKGDRDRKEKDLTVAKHSVISEQIADCEVSKSLMEFSPGQDPRCPEGVAGAVGVKLLIPSRMEEDISRDNYKLLRDVSSESMTDVWYDAERVYPGIKLRQIGFYAETAEEIQAAVKCFLEQLLSDKYAQACVVFVVPLCTGATLIGRKGMRIKDLSKSTFFIFD